MAFDWSLVAEAAASSNSSGGSVSEEGKVEGSKMPNYKTWNGMKDYVSSDERMKDLASRLNLTDQFANINSYLYKYKPEAQAAYQGDAHVDGQPHVGILAQELELNPITESTVKENPNTGYKEVDTAQLCLTLAAVVSDMAKEIKELKLKIGV